MEGDFFKPLVADPQFDALIPKPKGTVETIKRNAKLEDTIEFLPEAIRKCSWQVKKIVPLLRGDTLEETCRKIWTRLYNSIRYTKDEKNKEQIYSPRATWWRKKGDCDDFSVFISAILCEMKIFHLLRIAMYKQEDGYQHIYVVVPSPTGREIIIDCVLNRFNKEVPYIQKIDKPMELQFLDGVGDEFLSGTASNIDAQDLLCRDLGDLGRKKFRDTAFGKFLKKGLHAINRVNPATTLLRVGLLASLKINLFNVAGALRYTYLSDDEARKKGIDMGKFPHLKNVREKLEKIFFGAGGKEENLKHAILNGKGNENKEVPLSGFDTIEGSANEEDELPQLLGLNIYKSETHESPALGDPATGSAIAAASAVMGALAAIIKNIGIFKKKDAGDSGSADAGGATPDPAAAVAPTNDTTTPTQTNNSTPNPGSNTPPVVDTNTPKTDPAKPTGGGANTSDTPAAATEDTDDGSGARTANKASGKDSNAKDPSKNPSAMEKLKSWAGEHKTAIGLGVGAAILGGLIYAGVRYHKNKQKNQQGQDSKEKEAVKQTAAVAGTPKSKRYYGAHKQPIVIQKLR